MTDGEINRALAEKQLAMLQSSLASALDEHSASFRWLMASLLTLNGAGMLALKDYAAQSPKIVLISSSCFFLGITCALLLAWFGQRAIQKMIEPLGKLIGFWISVCVTGQMDDMQFSTFQGELTASKKAAVPTRWSGWASFIFFSLGIIISTQIFVNMPPSSPSSSNFSQISSDLQGKSNDRH